MLDATILGVGSAGDQAAGLEPVHDAGDVGVVAGQHRREFVHRLGRSGLHLQQSSGLGGMKIEFGRRQNEATSLGAEESAQNGPGLIRG